jgi:sugar phosphate isomerase/epimerase
MWAYHPDNRLLEAWNQMIEGLRMVSRIARRYGVRLAIEPETANVICDALVS